MRVAARVLADPLMSDAWLQSLGRRADTFPIVDQPKYRDQVKAKIMRPSGPPKPEQLPATCPVSDEFVADEGGTDGEE